MRVLRLPARAARPEAAGEAWEALAAGRADAVHFFSGPHPPAPEVLFPGAFNPLHQGHLRMAALASRRAGAAVQFEISVANVDKATIGREDALARLAQFAAEHSVILTRAPTFLEKSRLFPGATFVVGTDTVVRIADPRYYPSAAAVADAFAALAAAGVSFLVFGRRGGEGRFLTLGDLDLPPALSALCHEVPESEFRVDVSSTELREVGPDIE